MDLNQISIYYLPYFISKGNSTEILQLLLDSKFNPNSESELGRNPLLSILCYGNSHENLHLEQTCSQFNTINNFNSENCREENVYKELFKHGANITDEKRSILCAFKNGNKFLKNIYILIFQGAKYTFDLYSK